MKMRNLKLLAFSLFAVIATSGVALAVDSPTSVGEMKKVKGSDQAEPTRVFKLVHNDDRGANGASLVSGDIVVYSATADNGVTISRTNTSADGAIAGIVVTTIPTQDTGAASGSIEDVGRRNWGFILVHGPGSVNVTAGGSNAAVAGSPLLTSTDAGKAATANSTASVGAASRAEAIAIGKGGFFYDTVAASETVADVQVNLE